MLQRSPPNIALKANSAARRLNFGTLHYDLSETLTRAVSARVNDLRAGGRTQKARTSFFGIPERFSVDLHTVVSLCGRPFLVHHAGAHTDACGILRSTHGALSR